MDANQALRAAENSVRNLIAYNLRTSLGDNWIIKCGVTAERIKVWEERQQEEERRLGMKDERLLYYSDFYDLLTILKKHWSTCFAAIFGKQSKFETLWSILESYRNPDAHRRELLPYQVNLILGISGKIRTEITSYFSNMDTGESYFPRIESVQDSLGNTWTFGTNTKDFIHTNQVLRPGDVIQFVVTAFDPLSGKLEYSFERGFVGVTNWIDNPFENIEITEKDIGKNLVIAIAIRSERDYHARSTNDDIVYFGYTVLPNIIRS